MSYDGMTYEEFVTYIESRPVRLTPPTPRAHYVVWGSGAYVSCSCPIGHEHAPEAAEQAHAT